MHNPVEWSEERKGGREDVHEFLRFLTSLRYAPVQGPGQQSDPRASAPQQQPRQHPHRRLVIIDDIPFATFGSWRAGAGEVLALNESVVATLDALSRSSPLPIVICIDPSRTQFGADAALHWRAVMELPHAVHLSLNPVARTFAIKALVDLAERKGHLNVSAAAVEAIVDACPGDLRAATAAFQLYCTGEARENALGAHLAKMAAKGPKAKKKRAGFAPDEAGAGRASVQRLMGAGGSTVDFLSLFHFLGKILHAKRLPETEPSDKPAIATHHRRPAGLYGVRPDEPMPARGKLKYNQQNNFQATSCVA